MKRILTIIVLFTLLNLTAYGQRNAIRFIGFGYDRALITTLSDGISRSENAIPSNFAFLFSYERSFGEHLALGINLMLPLSLFDKGSQGYTLTEDNYYLGSGKMYTCNAYSEYQRFGLSYNSKFFFSAFSEEPEGLYIAPAVGFSNYALKMLGNTVETQSSSTTTATSAKLNDVDKSYNIMRLGVRLGVQYGGDFYIGYFFNADPGKNDDLPFVTPTAVNPGSFVIGYVWGPSF